MQKAEPHCLCSHQESVANTPQGTNIPLGALGDRNPRSSRVSHLKKVRVVKKSRQCSVSICQAISSGWLFLPIPGNAKGPEMVVDMFVHAGVSFPFKFIQS